MVVTAQSTFMQVFMLLTSLVTSSLCDLESGFSRGCYTACPRKTWNLQNSPRQQLDRQWIQCLKDCHKVYSWKSMIILTGIITMLAGIFVLIYICWGEKIRLKCVFHVQRNRRRPIISQQQTKIKIFEQGLKNFKQILNAYQNQTLIQFQNDKNQIKGFLIQDFIFQERKPNQLQNMFSIIIVKRRQRTQEMLKHKSVQLYEQSQDQIQFKKEEYSQLVGALSLTSKGLNLWWIKIDERPSDTNQKCRYLPRKYLKQYAVYERDPFASENDFIGNAVLLDSTKPPQQRFTRYYIKRKQTNEHFRNFQEWIIAT